MNRFRIRPCASTANGWMHGPLWSLRMGDAMHQILRQPA
jgi:hypothetical protein